MMRSLLTGLTAILLTGCAAPRLYEWGAYEQRLYASYKDPTKVEALRTSLEVQIAEVEKNGRKVAPGLYAEVGTLHLQAGSTDKAVEFYRRERQAWPESRGLMDALIGNVEKRRSKSAQAEESK